MRLCPNPTFGSTAVTSRACPRRVGHERTVPARLRQRVKGRRNEATVMPQRFRDRGKPRMRPPHRRAMTIGGLSNFHLRTVRSLHDFDRITDADDRQTAG